MVLVFVEGVCGGWMRDGLDENEGLQNGDDT